MGIIPNILVKIINAVEIIIIVECLLSWIVRDDRNEILNTLKVITDPILEPLKILQDKLLPRNIGIDFSPLIALLLLQILARIIYIIL